MHPDNSILAEQLLAIRQQLTAVHEQLVAINEQHRQLCTLVAQLQPAPAADSQRESGKPVPTVPVQEVLADCAQDILRVLREVGHPLTTLEILDQMVHRQMRWRESTVSHTLAELIDHDIVNDMGDGGLHRYQLRGER